jgi:hypothetical protein
VKQLYAAIQTKLTTDATLVALLGAANIGQWGSPAATVTPSVSYALASDVFTEGDQITGVGGPQEIVLQFTCVAKDDSSATMGGQTLVTDIAQQIMATLHGAAIGTATLFAWFAYYDNYMSAPIFDEETGEWRIDLRFRFMVKAI